MYIYYIYLFIYMYINIIFKQISTFNVLLKNISRIKTHNLSKITNISLLLRS